MRPNDAKGQLFKAQNPVLTLYNSCCFNVFQSTRVQFTLYLIWWLRVYWYLVIGTDYRVGSCAVCKLLML